MTVPAAAPIPTLEIAQPKPRTPQWIVITLIALAAVLVALIVAFAVVLTSQSHKITSLQNQLQEQKVALGHPDSKSSNLQQEVTALQAQASQASTTVSGLQGDLTQTQHTVSEICASGPVSNEQSQLNGEEVGSNTFGQYYGDLFGVINAICGNLNQNSG